MLPTIRTIIKWILMSALIAIGLFIASVLLLLALGYSPNGIGWEVAEKAAKKHDVHLCEKIIVVFNPLGLSPSAGEQRADCIREYAKLTKDPTACELLMPSEYGLSCINNVIAQEYKDDMESGFFDYSLCKNVLKDELSKDWCKFVRAHQTHSPSDCAGITNRVIIVGCREKFEAWQRFSVLRSSPEFGNSNQK